MMTTIADLFAAMPAHAPQAASAATTRPSQKYMIAFTPRSGSSYLCDRIEKTGAAGIPREILNKELMPIVLQQFPSRTASAYLDRVLAARASPLGVSGFKTTWFQLMEFTEALPAGHDWSDYRVIYLRREDLAAQAVSLYRAVRSSVFHTNVPVEVSASERLESLDYDYDEIARWFAHIVEQEEAWESYFARRSLDPLRIDYETVQRNIGSVLALLLRFVGVPDGAALPSEPSIFRKLGGSTSAQWADRFATEHLSRTGVAVRRAVAQGIPPETA